MTQPPDEERPLPFVAPCKKLGVDAPFRWLTLGWNDFKKDLRVSLTYGAVMMLISVAITYATWSYGNLGLYLGLISGFVFVGPLLALTLYDVSARHEQGLPVSLLASAKDAFALLGNAALYTVVLLVVFLIWARAASMVYIFMPLSADADVADLTLFLGIGSLVGSLFCAIIFISGAFSLPMILDRQTDMITAVITSANAVLRNKPVMLLWALFIVLSLLICFLTAYLAMLVLLPILGYASWHGYKETIDASDWPKIERH